jgi:uncharacterized NAD-dependent epimerase/dehydratase family protein
MGSLDREIQLLELLAGKPVLALTLNHERMTREEVEATVLNYEAHYQRPTTDILWHGCDKLVAPIQALLQAKGTS